jgi:hypothetical protein
MSKLSEGNGLHEEEDAADEEEEEAQGLTEHGDGAAGVGGDHHVKRGVFLRRVLREVRLPRGVRQSSLQWLTLVHNSAQSKHL